MQSLNPLRQKIAGRQALLGVIGLGYVGLPVACSFAGAGFRVTGVDTLPDRVTMINSGENPIAGKESGLTDLLTEVTGQGRFSATTAHAALAAADVVFINVETPVGEDHQPKYEALKAACSSLASVMKPGTLVIVESTIAPGTMDRVVGPLLEKGSGLKVNSGFYLGHCPERVMPGKLLANMRGMSRVCGGCSPETSEIMAGLYRHVVKADLDLCDCVTAELVKTVENGYRDLNIAFANEAALICETVGGDIWKVRELVNKSPGRDVLLPGGGVGGPCIPKDSWLLIANGERTAAASLIPAARGVNDYMPIHVADLTCTALGREGRAIQGARIGVLGYSYLENSGDTRNSPSIPLIKELEDRGGAVAVHDPFVHEYSGGLEQVVAGADAVVLMVAHDLYRTLDLPALREKVNTPIIVDTRNIIDGEAARRAGFKYVLLGAYQSDND